MFNEYPKALYQGGDVGAELAIVRNHTQEEQARAAGFASAGEKTDAAAASDGDGIKEGPARKARK